MVRLVTTSRIIAALERVPASTRRQLDLPLALELDGPVCHEQLIRLARHLRDSPQPASLEELLRGSRVYADPPAKKPEPSAEYLARKAQLLAAVETDAYNRLVSPASAAPSTYKPLAIFASSSPAVAALHDSASAADSEADDHLSVSLVVNIFLSVLLTGVSVYWALTKFAVFSSSGSRLTEPVRVLAAFAAALLVAVAEAVLYAVYMRKASDARATERRLKERKEVLAAVTSSSQQQQPQPQPQQYESEEIWGRGANGGLRRRVREQWDKTER